MAQKTAEGVTIAFLGTGAMDVDNATDLIEEFISATITSDDDPVRFVFPLTTDEFSDTMEELVEMAKQSDITYEVITHTGDSARRKFTEIANDAAKTYNVADVFTQLEHILAESPRSVLEVLWDKEREEELGEIVGKFVDAGVTVLDLTDGNVRMGEEDEEASEPTEAAEAITATTTDVEPAAEEEGAEDEEDVPIFARSDLEKMSRAEVKEISLKLGLPARKASATMIDAIMDLQGEPEEPEETPPSEPQVDVEVEVVEVTTLPVIGDTSDLTDALERFPSRLHDVLDEFLTNLGKTMEGVMYNAQPEEPMAVEEPEPEAPRRRLVRAR